MANSDIHLTLAQVAQATGKSYACVRRMVLEDKLSASSKNGRRHIALSDVTKVFPDIADTLLLTTGQAARYLGVLTEDIRLMAKQGKIKPIMRLDQQHRRFRLSDLQAIQDET